jgi:transposase-like protein
MSWVVGTKAYRDSNSEETCPKCGAVNRVEVDKQDGHNELEDYFCAKCNHKFGSARACNTPRTSVVNR